MNRPAYMEEPWFKTLTLACKGSSQANVARLLDTSRPLISQVLKGTGHYGSGRASTAKIRARVEQHHQALEAMKSTGGHQRAQAAYQSETWFKLLVEACEREPHKQVALTLGISPSLLSQILHASGHYGTGKSSTDNVAAKVQAVLGTFECPYLTEIMGAPRVIDVKRCRLHAHVRMPNTPVAYEHWQECRKCPKFALTAPPPPPPPVPKKRRKTVPTTPPTKPTTKESTS